MAIAKTTPRSLRIKPLAKEADDLEPILPAVAQSHEGIMESLIEIREIPNKGKGVVAVTNIPLGTRVLCEEPLLVCQCLPDKAILNSLVAAKLKEMPLKRQRKFLSLYNKDAGGPDPLAGIFDTNSLPLDATHGAVYPAVCRLNHSCRPNCMTSWNTALRRQTVHAVRPIEEGEELTLQYYNEPVDSRRAYLHEHFGFWCVCPACAQPHEELARSDVRRLRIERLLDDLENGVSRVASEPDACLLDCRALARLVADEYGGVVMGIEACAWYVAAQVCQAHGDHGRASAFAFRAYEARLVAEGDDSPTTAKMLRIAVDPCGEMGVSEDCSRGWASPVSLVPPEGYPADLYETWLWRQGTEGDDFDVDRYLRGRM